MIIDNERHHVNSVLTQVNQANPYPARTTGYWIYCAGFLAACLVNIMRDDPVLQRRFAQHCARARLPKQQ